MRRARRSWRAATFRTGLWHKVWAADRKLAHDEGVERMTALYSSAYSVPLHIARQVVAQYRKKYPRGTAHWAHLSI